MARRSWRADDIAREEKLKEAYGNKPRGNCKEYKNTGNCYKCQYARICSVYNDGTEEYFGGQNNVDKS